MLLVLTSVLVATVSASDVSVPSAPTRPRLLSKEVFIPNDNGRAVATGFVSYISRQEPVLMHCFGRVDFSDGYDDFAVQISRDNGRTWSNPEVRWKSAVVPEGRMRYAEPAAFFDAERGKLVVLITRTLYPKDKLNTEADFGLELNVYDAVKGEWTERRELKFPGQRIPAMSFSFPVQTTGGRLLFPGMRKTVDASGRAIRYQNTWKPVDESVAMIGEWGSDGELTFHLGQPISIAPERSSRGLNEHTLAELRDGRIAAVCRGDNSAFPEKPGHKWLSFSRDGGESWSAPAPLPATNGEPFESGANGSALFPSRKNGKLYWLGNLALHGERAKGNWPRSPLCLVEVQEEPFALKRETVFAIDERNFNDSPRVQLSNFRFYEDRESGELVVFLSRFGERSERDWMAADYYRYRIELP